MPLFISFYTSNSPYPHYANLLRQNLYDLGVHFEIVHLKQDLGWVETAAKKAQFIHEMLMENKASVCWLDIDSKLLKVPEFISQFDKDFGIVSRGGWNFHGGQILFGYTEAAVELLDIWVKYTAKYPRIWDQVSLSYAYWELGINKKIETFWIPEDSMYKRKKKKSLLNFISRPLGRLESNVIFYHYQASNIAKRHQPESKEFTSWDLPEWWRLAMIRKEFFELNSVQQSELGLSSSYSK